MFANVEQLCSSSFRINALCLQVQCNRSSTQPTSLPVGERPPEGSPHADLSILQVVHSQVPDWDGLSVHLEAAPVVPGHRSCQNQEL